MGKKNIDFKSTLSEKSFSKAYTKHQKHGLWNEEGNFGHTEGYVCTVVCRIRGAGAYPVPVFFVYRTSTHIFEGQHFFNNVNEKLIPCLQ